MNITIKGEALVRDCRGDEVRDTSVLEWLHGVSDNECFSDYFHEEEEALERLAGVSGGFLSFEFENGKLYALTSYECTRKLSPHEEDVLKDYTVGQWSDGIGECFEQNSVQDVCISAWHKDQIVEISYTYDN